MIGVDEAKRLLLHEAAVLGSAEVPLEQALGRVLAEEIRADRDLPPASVSSMDGFALRAADATAPGASLRVVGEAKAGCPPRGPLGPGEAVRIFTGAILPPAADAVVMVELTREDRAARMVELLERPAAGQNVRVRGEDLREGERVLPAGAPVHSAEVAALAAVGRTTVRVYRPPSIAVLATGDELVGTDRAPLPHQVRNSNASALLAQVREMGLEASDLGIAADEPEDLSLKLARGLGADLLLITGGVSMGAYDLVGEALSRAGTRLLFHQVAVRPGKPLLAGRCGNCLVVGLPGNPVSAYTSFAVFVVPAVRRMMGHDRVEGLEVRAILGGRLERRPGRTTYHLARLEQRNGTFVALPVRTTGSADMVSLVRANAFLVTPGAPDALEAGSEVAAVPWRDFHLR